MKPSRNLYPTDVSDDEWAFVAPYLILLPEDAGQRTYSLREIFNGLRWIARAGAPWCMMPNDLPPWWVVYQQTRALGWPQAVLPLSLMTCTSEHRWQGTQQGVMGGRTSITMGKLRCCRPSHC